MPLKPLTRHHMHSRQNKEFDAEESKSYLYASVVFEDISDIEDEHKAIQLGLYFYQKTIIMDFDCLLEINRKHRVLVCRQCQYAIVLSQLATHLKVHHPRLTLQQRRDYSTKVESYSTLAKVHEDVVYLALNDPPVPSL